MAPLDHGAATSFKNNTAENGGAVSIVDGAIGSWRGDTSFIGNIADRVYGGAIHVFNGACVLERAKQLHTKFCTCWARGVVFG